MHGIRFLKTTFICPVCGKADGAHVPGTTCRACGIAVDDRTAIRPIVLSEPDAADDAVEDEAAGVEFGLVIPVESSNQVGALESLLAAERK